MNNNAKNINSPENIEEYIPMPKKMYHKEINDVALTTIDNPYSPFEEFDKWYNYDQEKGYDSCALLSRVIDEQTKLAKYHKKNMEENEIINISIDSICRINPNGKYRKAIKGNENIEYSIM